MELFDFFTGKWLSTVDAKGRVSVPAPIRKIISARIKDEDGKAKAVMLAKHERDPCMRGFDKGYLNIAHEDMREKIRQDVAAGRPTDEKFSLNASLFGSSLETAIDGSGRIILSPIVRRRLGITDTAMFVGVGETFEIWSPEKALVCAERPEIREFAEELIEERDGGL